MALRGETELVRWRLTTSANDCTVRAVSVWHVYESTEFHLGNPGLGQGGTAFIPLGVTHGYQTFGEEDMRLLDIHCSRPAVKGVPHQPPDSII